MEEIIIRKPFKSGGSTAIRFPKSLDVELTDEIEISMPEDGVIVMKVLEASWESKLKAAVASTEARELWSDLEEPSREAEGSHRVVGDW